MSRTFKDRPYRVLITDPKMPREVYHDHTSFGRDIYGTRQLRNADGSLVFHTEQIIVPASRFNRVWCSVSSAVKVFFRIYLGSDDEDLYSYVVAQAEQAIRAGNYDAQIHLGERTRPVFGQVLLYTMPDHCTLDEPDCDVPRMCGYELSYPHRYYRNRPDSSEKKTFHGGARSKERTPLLNAKKLYNSGEEVDDYDHEDLETRDRFHYGYWD